MSLIRNYAIAAASAILLTGSKFAFTAVLARRLSVDGFGHFAYALWLVDIAFLACAMGSTGAVSRYTAEFRNDEIALQGFLRVWLRWALGLTLLTGVAVLIGAWLSNYRLDAWSKFLLSMWAIASAIMAMNIAASSGAQRFDLIFRCNVIYALIILIGAWRLPLESDDTNTLFALMAIASITSCLPFLSLKFKISHNTQTAINPVNLRGVKHYALNMWLVALLSSLVFSRGELPIVQTLLGSGGVATYVAVLTLFNGAIQGVMLGASAPTAQLTVLWGKGQKDAALALARNIMDFQLLVCGVLALVLIFIGPELLSLAFGENYRTHSSALAILSPGLLFMAMANQNHLLQITTNGQFNRNGLLYVSVILMVLAYTLTSHLGILGSATARSASLLLFAGLIIYNTSKRWGARAVSLKNIASVGFVTIFSIFLCEVDLDINRLMRISMLLVNSIFLTILVKGADGNPIALNAYIIIRAKLRQKVS